MTRGTVKADSSGTVIDVFTAVIASPTIDAHTGVTPDCVKARTTIVTSIGLHETFIDVLGTILPCPLRQTLTVVRVDTIYADPTIHALVSRAVIHVFLTVVSLESWHASTLVGVVTSLMAGASVNALRRGTWLGGHLTCPPTVPSLALAAERAMRVHADSAVKALSRFTTLVDVIVTVLSLIPRWARTVVVIIPIGTTTTVGTGICGTRVNQGTVLTSESSLAHTGVLWDSISHLALASGSI